MSVADTVRKFLTDQEYIEKGEIVDDSESLLERGIIDSVGIAKLVGFLEETYKIKVDEDDLMPENFDSIDAINDYVTGKTNA